MANLIDAFDDCVERVYAGESIERCLRDYPQYAERLRDLLQTGELVYRAHDANAATGDARQEVRTQVVNSYRKRRQRGTRRRNWFVPLAAVASVTLALGLLAVFMVATNQSLAPFDITSAAIRLTNAEVEVALHMTETQVFFDSRRDLLTPTPDIAYAGATALPLEMMAVPGHAATPGPDINVTPMPTISQSDVELTATALRLLLNAGGGPTPNFDLGLAGTPAPTGLPESGGGYVVTSVAGMSPAPFTPAGTEVESLSIATATATPTGMVTVTLTSTPLPTGSPEATSIYPPTPTPPQEVANVDLGSATPIPLPEVIPLNAGEIDDNERWDHYLEYRNNFFGQYGVGVVRNVNVTGRQIIRVRDERGLPVLGARVMAYAGQSLVSETLTYATGETLFFPNAGQESQGYQSFRILVQKGNNTVEFTLDPQSGPVWDVTLEEVPALGQVRLDVLFLLDTTGSMGDELAQLQNNIQGISAQIARLPGTIDARYGLVTYRDRGDTYVTRVYDFTPDVGTFQLNLNAEYADGGGDEPESLNEALHQAAQGVSWRGEDTVKLVFLVADAPPHLDYPQDYDYAQEMVVAAQRGIKIHPIASSGLSPVGEFIFRQIAQYTMGHFVFLTYAEGAAGAPGIDRPDLNVGEPESPAVQQSQSDYTVEHLDDLVLRLITDELASLTARTTASATNAVAAHKVNPDSATASFNPSLLVLLVAASFLLGYSFRLRKSVKLKRKNRERQADWTDHRF